MAVIFMYCKHQYVKPINSSVVCGMVLKIPNHFSNIESLLILTRYDMVQENTNEG